MTTRKKDSYMGETVERTLKTWRADPPVVRRAGHPPVCGLFEFVQLVGGVIHIHKIPDRGVIEDAE
jgi:hypothetical protein